MLAKMGQVIASPSMSRRRIDHSGADEGNAHLLAGDPLALQDNKRVFLSQQLLLSYVTLLTRSQGEITVVEC